MPSYTCAKCHKQLSDANSVEKGFGPACFLKVKKDIEQKQGIDPLLSFLHAEASNEDIVLQRDKHGNACTNVWQLVALHSATGFQWGNTSLGSADLAYNILIRFGMDRKKIDRVYHDFKRKFIANVPENGVKIKAKLIKKWIKENE